MNNNSIVVPNSNRNLILIFIIILLLFFSITNYFTLTRMKCSNTNEEKIKKLELKIKELNNILKLEHEEILNKPKIKTEPKEKEEEKKEKYNLPLHPKIIKEKIEKNEIEMKKLVSTLKYHPSKFVIAIVAANRPQYLKKLFESLRRVEYWNKENTVLFQYGDSEPINHLGKDLQF